jgi:hypothetical protein
MSNGTELESREADSHHCRQAEGDARSFKTVTGGVKWSGRE